MAKISPWDDHYRRPSLKREARSFPLDPDEPEGKAIRLTFEELDECSGGIAIDKAREYESRYVPAAGGTETLLTPDGRVVPMSGYLCRVIANLEAMERPEQGDRWAAGEWAYTLLDWIGIAQKFPRVWREILRWGNEFLGPNREPDEEGNSPGATPETSASTGTSSTSPST